MDLLMVAGLTALKGTLALGIGVLNVLIIIYMERKVMADMQLRYGPMRVGPHGTLQLIADFVKILGKEDIIPENSDKLLFKAAPFMVFVPSFLLYLVIPISENVVVADMDVGFFYLFGVLTAVSVGILIAGWASHSKYSLLGGMRSAAQQISYEIPLLVSILGVVMIAGTLSLTAVVEAQRGAIEIFGLPILPRWFIFLQPFGFLFFFIAALADLNRTPFDIPEAESELVAGFFTEYSSVKFLLFMLAEYSNLMIVSAIAVVTFLGGWNGPILPPIVWFFIKVYALVYFMIWVRATLPRVRMDQLMDLGWKILLPATLINVVVTGFLLL